LFKQRSTLTPAVNGIWKFPFGREVPMPAFNAQLRGLDGDTATDFAGSSSEDGSILSISASLWPGFEW
jgi:hypothetical protein